MPEKKGKYKRYQVPRLRFPTNLKFTTSGDSHLLCNGKKVQIVASQIILPEDNPPVDFDIHGIGKFNFSLTGADVYIFHFANVRDKQTDCAIIKKDELEARLEPYHYDGDKIKIKLILTDRALHECLGYGAEGFFMALWINEKRNFIEYHNNWQLLCRS